MEQFVKAIEIWVPGTHHRVLELGSAFYGQLEAFKHQSESMQFAYNEGLPGKTWAQGQAIVLTDLQDSYFQRAEAARLADIVCAISLPFYCGECLQGVVVLFCGGHAVPGAMEVWHNQQNPDHELRLQDGYYGDLERFEWISRKLTIMRGRGLPGTAWEQGRPIIVDDLAHSNSFLRASNAAEAGITTGLAIPFFSEQNNLVQVFALLSARGTPIAKQFEIWMLDAQTQVLRFDSGHSANGTDLSVEYADTSIRKGEGVIGEAWLSGRPLVISEPKQTDSALVILPVMRAGKLTAMVTLRL